MRTVIGPNYPFHCLYREAQCPLEISIMKVCWVCLYFSVLISWFCNLHLYMICFNLFLFCLLPHTQFFFKKDVDLFSFIFCVGLLCLHVHMCIPSMPGVWAVQEKASDPSEMVTGNCEPPCEHWELNLVSLQEQQVLFTAEPSLQPINLNLVNQ